MGQRFGHMVLGLCLRQSSVLPVIAGTWDLAPSETGYPLRVRKHVVVQGVEIGVLLLLVDPPGHEALQVLPLWLPVVLRLVEVLVQLLVLRRLDP